ncbi:phosphopantetheine-binding protein [Streptomyces sp. NPDC003247]|uniref:phosphopantetheine-binding protein n=1 Tax=Streptomyces sp. NPDC003247 TaxID=3364677 RepID=UPI003696CBEE
MSVESTVETICALWSDLLAVQVSPDDDFFELGGYSLLLMQMVFQAEEAGLCLTPEQVVDHPTPRKLAEAITVGTAG